MPQKTLTFLLFSIFSWTFVVGQAQPSNKVPLAPRPTNSVISAVEMLGEMIESCKKIHSMQFEVKKNERIEDGYLEGLSSVKLKTKPYQVYLKQYEPTHGLEVLFLDGQNDNKAYINPSGFPWMNLSLDPYSSIMRKNQHHVIYDIGFEKFNGIIEHLLKKYSSSVSTMVSCTGEVVVSNRSCHVLEYQNPYYSNSAYVVGENETTFSLASRLKLSEYRILELNPGLSYGDLKTGTSLVLPSDYSPRMKLYIDQEQMIPIRFEVFDEFNKLLESYEYQNVKINVKFADNELNSDYPDYGF